MTAAFPAVCGALSVYTTEREHRMHFDKRLNGSMRLSTGGAYVCTRTNITFFPRQICCGDRGAHLLPARIHGELLAAHLCCRRRREVVRGESILRAYRKQFDDRKCTTARVPPFLLLSCRSEGARGWPRATFGFASGLA